MPKFTHDWGSHNFPIWKELLKHILTHPTSAVIVMDTFAGSMEFRDQNFEVGSMEKTFRRNLARYRKRVRIKKGVSQLLLRKLTEPVDFVYVDGSHQAADVLEDAALSFRLLKPGGILIFDDYLWQHYPQAQFNPALGIDAFLAGFAGRYKLLHKDYQVAIEKMGT